LSSFNFLISKFAARSLLSLTPTLATLLSLSQYEAYEMRINQRMERWNRQGVVTRSISALSKSRNESNEYENDEDDHASSLCRQESMVSTTSSSSAPRSIDPPIFFDDAKELLCEFARSGSVSYVKLLLKEIGKTKNFPNPNAANFEECCNCCNVCARKQWTPLMWALRCSCKNHKKIQQLLLDAPFIDVNAVGDDGDILSSCGDPSCEEHRISLSREPFTRTALSVSINWQELHSVLPTMKLLIDAGADIDAKSRGYSPLHECAASGQSYIESARLLIGSGAGASLFYHSLSRLDPISNMILFFFSTALNAKTSYGGCTALQLACSNGNDAVAMEIVNAFSLRTSYVSDDDVVYDEDYEESIDGYEEGNNHCPLSLACLNGNASLVTFLIAAGANVNLKSGEFYYAPPLLCALDDLAVTKALVEAGADMNAGGVIDGSRENALSLCVFADDYEVLDYLLEQGLKLHSFVADEEQVTGGSSVEDAAADASGRLDLRQEIDNEADLFSPYSQALVHGNTSTIEVLERHGVFLNNTNQFSTIYTTKKILKERMEARYEVLLCLAEVERLYYVKANGNVRRQQRILDKLMEPGFVLHFTFAVYGSNDKDDHPLIREILAYV
jgi:ankyrin repeat protein